MTSQNKYNKNPLPKKDMGENIIRDILKYTRAIVISISKIEMIETYLIHAKEKAYTDRNECLNYIDDALAELKRLKEQYEDIHNPEPME